MLSIVQQFINKIIRNQGDASILIHWIKQSENSWLRQQFQGDFIKPSNSIYSSRIEKLARQTNELGSQPLWEGYANNNIGGSTRTSNQVRTDASMGDLYTSLVRKRKPNIMVEFGTAFGVSGMYFLAGIESNGEGRLLTFEPNRIWAKLARNNLSQISNRFDLIVGTFEENIENSLAQNQRIDIAFIDAIHTKEFVIPQLEIVVAKSSSQAIVILDDINFSDDMYECWKEVSIDSRFSASATLGDRVGILELA
jgi:predicted O-methyltransferase YrrM